MHTRALQGIALAGWLLVSLLSPTARADEQPATGAVSASSESQNPPSANPAQPAAKGDMDFDLFDDKPKLDPAAQAAEARKIAEIDRKVKLRRQILTAHQAIGFTTLAVMAATVILGQVNYVARYGGLNNGQDYDRFQNAHLGLSISTSALFTTLGILGLAAPNPYPKPIKADAALVHKVSMALATAGMVTQLILGPITAIYGGKLEQRDMALGHVITGYATFGFMSAGVLAYVF